MAQAPGDQLPRFLDIVGGERRVRCQPEVQPRRLDRPHGQDLDPDEASSGKANDLDQVLILPRLGRDDVMAELESEVVGSDDGGAVEDDLGVVDARASHVRIGSMPRETKSGGGQSVQLAKSW